MTGTPRKAWRCLVCGYIHTGDEPPGLCPVCGAAKDEFEAHAEPAPAAAAVPRSDRWRCINCNYIHEGDEPPGLCPVCAAARDKFEPVPTAAAKPAVRAVRVVIIGAGIAGVSAAETLRQASPDSAITLLSTEPEIPYYRLNLTRYLAGEITRDTLPIHPLSWYAEHRIALVLGATVAGVDAQSHAVTLEDGRVFPCDRLLLAPGSHPFVPPLEGVGLPGVFTLRTAADADALLAAARPGARAICIGGGILGIETAGALARRKVAVTLLEGHDWLMPRQLNARAASRLERHMNGLGVAVLKKARTAALEGGPAVAAVRLQDGRRLPADLVVLATGVRPNTALARKLALEVNTGIVVNNHLETSAPGIYAVGDAAEHNGQVYGAWAPAQYQGSIAALNILGAPTAFGGLPRANTVKALGLDLTSIGRFQPEDGASLTLEQEEANSYSAFIFRDNRLIGALLVNRAALAAPAKKAIETAADFSDLLRAAPAAADVARRLQNP